MKKGVLLLVFFLFGVHDSWCQGDKRLMERLDSVLLFTQESDFESILDFTYPKLFTIVTRPQMMKVLNDAVENEEFSASFDSVKVIKIYPPFTSNNGTYVRISHSMIMLMKFNEVIDTTDTEGLELMITLMEADFGEKSVRFDKATNTFRIFTSSILVAIKDEFSPEWTFLNFEEDEKSVIAPLLFSQDVLQKLRSPQ